MSDPLYRVRQFLHSARAMPLTGAEVERVCAVLKDDALALYQTMSAGDQRHSLNILNELSARGHTASPLLQAALLHDVAKRDVGLVYRAGVIVFNKVSPRAVSRLASANPRSWRYPFYLALHHPKLGAELAARAGVQEYALALIRAHQDKAPIFQGPEAARLALWHDALKALDDVN